MENSPQLHQGKVFPPHGGGLGGSIIEPHHRLPYNPKLKERARELRKDMTKPEQRMWFEVLGSKKLKRLNFLRQRPIDNYIVDFYCAELKLVIEIDGDSHDGQEECDDIRTDVLENYELKVIRYKNKDVINNLESVYDDLLEQIRKRKKELE
jgi:very-short-patch-repair endonuclease